MHGAWAQYMRRLGPGEGDRAPVVGDLMDWDVTAVRVPVERVPPGGLLQCVTSQTRKNSRNQRTHRTRRPHCVTRRDAIGQRDACGVTERDRSDAGSHLQATPGHCSGHQRGGVTLWSLAGRPLTTGHPQIESGLSQALQWRWPPTQLSFLLEGGLFGASHSHYSSWPVTWPLTSQRPAARWPSTESLTTTGWR